MPLPPHGVDGRRSLPARLLLLVLIALAAPRAVQAEVIDRIVLRVNDRIATLTDYEKRRSEALAQITEGKMSPEERSRALNGVGPRVYRDMFEELLLLSRADQTRANPSDEEVDTELGRIRERFGIANDDQFAAALGQQGMTLTSYREQIRTQLRIREVVFKEIQGTIKLEEDDLRRYYRANQDQFRIPARRRVREIVVLDREGVPASEQNRRAAEIASALQGGKVLDQIAEELQPLGITSGVIDLDWVAAGELAVELEKAVWDLPTGGVSPPTASRGGLHIVQVVERQEPGVMAFTEVAQAIENRERDRLFEEKMKQFMRTLEENAYVKANPPADAADFRTVAGSKSRADRFEPFDPSAEAKKTLAEPAQPPG
ncbi:MAG: peptidyl-prolyl cis-trans isomerase [Thermoanaerobaculia bacterium]|nr:peptidyl-prolyl cis-trans isomerase [Thermoanaerobaculia bacterium]